MNKDIKKGDKGYFKLSHDILDGSRAIVASTKDYNGRKNVSLILKINVDEEFTGFLALPYVDPNCFSLE